MHIELSKEQVALREELKEYFAGLMAEFPPEKEGEDAEEVAGGTRYRSIVRRLGSDGWLGVGWPKEYGGHGRGPLDQLIFLDEAAKAGVPIPMVTLNTVGPTIAQWGTDAQKEKFLPAILKGECHFAIGYTEPGAGTDLASLQTRAVLDGDEWVVNGQKVFTTGAHDADYIWLACRTDPDAPKHKGISILLTSTDQPGFSWTPIYTIGSHGGRGHHTNATFYDDVRVPADMVCGPVHGGWKMITTQLNFERVALGPSGAMFAALDKVVRWAREERLPDGTRHVDQQWVRLNLARVRAMAEAAELFNWRVASLQEHGQLNPADASAMKVYGTEGRIEVLRLLMEVVGPAATLRDGSAGAVLAGHLEHEYKRAIVGTFGGGVNEIQREIVCMAGLQMPRVPR
jgi:3-oxocholest-4-en-26-oyl-CoA dehydrogenase alpha subunit